MTKTTTIQISVYDWYIMEEIIYEAQIGSIEDFLALTYRFDKKVMFKKTTDKNWYYAKTMIKRLFKKEVAKNRPVINFVTTNDLNKIEEKKQKAKEEAKLKKEEEELAWEQWRKENPDFTREQVKSMSEVELANRLIELYVEDYYIGETDYDSYCGPFKCCLTEITYIESQVSTEIADRAYLQAFEGVFGSKHEGKLNRLPKSNIFQLTNDYELEYIGPRL